MYAKPGSTRRERLPGSRRSTVDRVGVVAWSPCCRWHIRSRHLLFVVAHETVPPTTTAARCPSRASWPTHPAGGVRSLNPLGHRHDQCLLVRAFRSAGHPACGAAERARSGRRRTCRRGGRVRASVASALPRLRRVPLPPRRLASTLRVCSAIGPAPFLHRNQQRGGEEDRRVRADDDADELDQRQILERADPEHPHRDDHQRDHRAAPDDGRVDRPHRVWFTARFACSP